LKIAWVSSVDNPADLGTKALQRDRHEALTSRIGLVAGGDIDFVEEVLMVEEGRCASSADAVQGPWDVMTLFAVSGISVAIWIFGSWVARTLWTPSGPSAPAPSTAPASPSGPETATVATQSPVTYSMLRGARAPRFVVLAPAEQGVFAESVQEEVWSHTLRARPGAVPKARPRRTSSSSAGAQHQAEIQAREDWYADRSPGGSDATPESE
jgi:hypothetical protein